jgi:toxin ParE1/3/4
LAEPGAVRVRWTRPAVQQLIAIGEYIADRNPAAARKIERRLRAAVEALVRFPLMGHEGRVPGTRELNVPGTPYVIPYRLDGECVDILAIFHGAQQRDLS